MDLSVVKQLEKPVDAYALAEERLREEVRRAVECDYFAPQHPARYAHDDDTWRILECGTCAIGALVARSRVSARQSGFDQCKAAAQILGVDRLWIEGVFGGVMYPSEPELHYGEPNFGTMVAGLRCGARLRQYAIELGWSPK